ncbi:MAG: NAD+ synthase (glutamine-hydrolysing) [Candidatus Nitrotoga sp. CP45]|nr:MAG: NAD+ synthase (glutamine-hydrolysing) [Candidatus Nitrotoga sp. CP45]
MKLAVAQINCMLGDLAGNSAKILAYAEKAKQQGAALLLTPELSLCGYPPEDLLLRAGFYRTCDQALHELAQQIGGITVVVGHPHELDGKRYNAASVLRDGQIIATYHKHELPNYSVFDERRYFTPGNSPCIFEMQGVKFALNICADIWKDHTAQRAYEAGAQVLLVLNASPYHIDKQPLRYKTIRDRIGETGLTVIYANMVGGQDELVFDGASFAMDAHGTLTHQFVSFEETLALIEIHDGKLTIGERIPALKHEDSIYRALCLGVKDYIGKNRFPGVLLGLSGGIDSALTLAVAVDALGADKVHTVMMPSPYTAKISLDDAREMAVLLGVRYDELDIKPTFDAYLTTLDDMFKGLTPNTTEENLQARIRGNLLMALSNKFGSLVLTTGNKSEMTVGYCTLYGDMAGGFAVLKDVSKTWVYRLASYRNSLSRVIPERIITRPPSAELKPDQTDQDSLPPYDVLDGIMSYYVEQNLTIAEIVAHGYTEADVYRVVNMIRVNEYKRRQAPVGVRITDRGFGKDWRYPITARYQDGF